MNILFFSKYSLESGNFFEDSIRSRFSLQDNGSIIDNDNGRLLLMSVLLEVLNETSKTVDIIEDSEGDVWQNAKNCCFSQIYIIEDQCGGVFCDGIGTILSWNKLLPLLSKYGEKDVCNIDGCDKCNRLKHWNEETGEFYG